MCGIVGLFLKSTALEPELGRLTSAMLHEMCDRGPDSAGFAVYTDANPGITKICVVGPAETDWPDIVHRLESAIGSRVGLKTIADHVILTTTGDSEAARKWLIDNVQSATVLSHGQSIETFKGVGSPDKIAKRLRLADFSGTHAIGHTRMATESAVTTLGAHPFSTGPDECLVHNGSLSNHNNVRRELVRDGMTFETENDTEVAAAYLTWRMNQGMDLGQALTRSLDDLDGFYTFVVGTKTGLGVLRDPIACKPAVLAETDRYVAFGSEYRALVDLPDIETAKVWEPEPATVYFWGR